MDILSYILIGLLSGLMGIALLVLGYKVFDYLTPRWEIHEIFLKGYVSNGGIVIAAFLLGLSFIIANAIT